MLVLLLVVQIEPVETNALARHSMPVQKQVSPAQFLNPGKRAPAPEPVEGGLAAEIPPTLQSTDSQLLVEAQLATADDQGTIIVKARERHVRGDPMEPVNAKSYAVTQSVDKAVVGPIASGYRHVIPPPIRSGLHNAITNLREPTIFLNDILQIKPGRAAGTLGRIAINSTLGIAGLFDVAKRGPFGIRHHANGFADSFGYYGIGPGPYMFLPLVGPTTLRDLIGGGLDRLVLPLAVGQPFNQLAYSIPTGAVSALDHRVEIDEQLVQIRAAENPYAALRTAYLHNRQAEIDGLKGKSTSSANTTAAP